MRKQMVRTALSSYKELSEVIAQLTEWELRAALAIESQTRRRTAVMERLVRRLVRLVELRTRQQLERRYLDV